MAQRLKGITVSRDELMKEMAERQQADAARKRAEAALRESEAQFARSALMPVPTRSCWCRPTASYWPPMRPPSGE